MPIFREGKFEAALTLIYFAAAMKQGEAVERYIDDLRQTAELVSQEMAVHDYEVDLEAMEGLALN